MPRPFDLVVFDWDGTVVDSTTMIARSIQKAAADLGLRVPSLERASHVIGLGLRDALAAAVPDLAADRIEAFTERYRHHYIAIEQEIVLFSGIRELLVELTESGAVLAVATGKSRRGLDRSLAATGLGMFFAASRCADETHPKPHPAMLHEITGALAMSPQRTVMIGDTTHDLAMARSAGTASIGVTYGAHPRAQLEGGGALALVDDVAELRTWLVRTR
ncbi:MAG TPA: HAD-IA family hydrolase [Burkholderiaceae bacterium]|nr:HAD-IA family hydrolase [Burkholderiaceae bacterium]